MFRHHDREVARLRVAVSRPVFAARLIDANQALVDHQPPDAAVVPALGALKGRHPGRVQPLGDDPAPDAIAIPAEDLNDNVDPLQDHLKLAGLGHPQPERTVFGLAAGAGPAPSRLPADAAPTLCERFLEY